MKYCKYCGLPLEDGETCSCPESQAKSSGTQGAYGSGGGYAPYSGGYGRTGGAYNAGGLLDLVGTVFRAPLKMRRTTHFQRRPGAPPPWRASCTWQPRGSAPALPRRSS